MLKPGDKVVGLSTGAKYTINYVDDDGTWVGINDSDNQETFQVLYPIHDFILEELYESPLGKAICEKED